MFWLPSKLCIFQILAPLPLPNIKIACFQLPLPYSHQDEAIIVPKYFSMSVTVNLSIWQATSVKVSNFHGHRARGTKENNVPLCIHNTTMKFRMFISQYPWVIRPSLSENHTGRKACAYMYIFIIHTSILYICMFYFNAHCSCGFRVAQCLFCSATCALNILTTVQVPSSKTNGKGDINNFSNSCGVRKRAIEKARDRLEEVLNLTGRQTIGEVVEMQQSGVPAHSQSLDQLRHWVSRSEKSECQKSGCRDTLCRTTSITEEPTKLKTSHRYKVATKDQAKSRE